MPPPIPDWQLPPGVDRGLWHYTHSSELAEQYDASLAGSSLIEADIRFCERHFLAPGPLIDLGCGTGRLATYFAQKGFTCVGVDLSHEMLTVARQKAQEANVQVDWLQANLVELDAIESSRFEYAACLFSTLGMIRGRAHQLQTLRHIRRLLRPNGTFVLHVHNRWFLGWRGVWGQAWRDLWQTILHHPTAGDRTALMPRAGAEVTLHHFTRREALRDLQEAGFRIVEVQPVGIDGPLRSSWLTTWRAYGYLIAASCS